MVENQRQQIQRRIRSVSTLTGISTALLSALVVTMVMRAQMLAEQHDYLDNGVARVSEMLVAVEQSLWRLNSLELKSCQVMPSGSYDDNLAAMHRELFRNPYIIDIGFFRGDWLNCTTGRGIIPNPMRSAPADAKTNDGREFWFNQELYLFLVNGRYEGSHHTLVRQQNYNAVLNLIPLAQQLKTNGDWRLLVRHGDKTDVLLSGNNTAGASGIDGTATAPDSRWIPEEQRCTGTDVAFCLQAHQTFAQWLTNYIGLLLVLVGFCLGSGFLAGFYTARELGRRYSKTRRIERGLRNGAFSLAYIPILDLRSKRNIGCEAIAQFEDKFGSIPREEFIPIIRRLGLTWDFTQTMLELGLPQLHRHTDWPPRFRINFNVFNEDIVSGAALALRDMQVFEHSRFRYIIELREDSALQGETGIDTSALLEQAGFWLALDHFGIGHSNLVTLQEFNCRVIKIDPSLIRNIENRSLQSSLIPSIVNMAKGQQIVVVADGIDSLRQIDALLEAEILWGQGDALSPPLSIDELHAQTLGKCPKDNDSNETPAD